MRLPTRLSWAFTLILIAVPLFGAVGGLVGAPGHAMAQDLSGDSIFRRFATTPRRSEGRLRFLEVPVAMRPQTDSGADVSENIGFGYTVGFQPYNRVFVSLGFHFARMEWRPSDPAIASADVKQIDVSQSLNFWFGRRVFFSVGLGLGLMDSLVVTNTGSPGNFEHNVVPYMPLRTGATVAFGDSVFLGLRVASTPFFGQGPVTGHTRLSLGLGWTY